VNRPRVNLPLVTEENLMRRTSILVVALTFALCSATAAQQRRGTRFWNLTRYTITTLQMSPAGQNVWGPNQCANDKDGEVDHDERLRITGVSTGRYDVRFTDKGGRTCVVTQVDVKDGEIFSIEEKELTDCRAR
jgi:hypothetical protein